MLISFSWSMLAKFPFQQKSRAHTPHSALDLDPVLSRHLGRKYLSKVLLDTILGNAESSGYGKFFCSSPSTEEGGGGYLKIITNWNSLTMSLMDAAPKLGTNVIELGL